MQKCHLQKLKYHIIYPDINTHIIYMQKKDETYVVTVVFK